MDVAGAVDDVEERANEAVEDREVRRHHVSERVEKATAAAEMTRLSHDDDREAPTRDACIHTHTHT